MKKTLLVVLGLFLFTVALGLTVFLMNDGRYAKELFSRYDADTASKDLVPAKINCTPKDGHAEGMLTSQFNITGTLIGWSCSMGSHMNCTAGPDGIWNECDFPPDVMMWPDPVPKDALANPKMYSNLSQENAEY